MYARQSNKFPGWLIVLAAMLLVFGGYYIWQGFMAFMATNGNIAAPVTATAFHTILEQTITSNAPGSTLDLSAGIQITLTATKVCQQFKVKVLKARIRECAKDTCNTIDLPVQGTTICVYGVSPDATDWYEINVNPTDPIPQLGYMHDSVLVPLNPTARPLNLPTVTLVPSATRKPTANPPPTNTPNPAAPATWTLTPTPTPVPPISSA